MYKKTKMQISLWFRFLSLVFLNKTNMFLRLIQLNNYLEHQKLKPSWVLTCCSRYVVFVLIIHVRLIKVKTVNTFFCLLITSCCLSSFIVWQNPSATELFLLLLPGRSVGPAPWQQMGWDLPPSVTEEPRQVLTERPLTSSGRLFTLQEVWTIINSSLHTNCTAG